MKKLMSMMLGLSLVLGCASLALSQDATPKKTGKKSGKKGKKKSSKKSAGTTTPPPK